MTEWITVGPAADFAAGSHRCVTASGLSLVVLNVEGAFYVLRNQCPHAGLPLGDGERTGYVITCPYHGYAYNIRNGRNVHWPEEELPVQTYPVRVEDGQLQIEVKPRE